MTDGERFSGEVQSPREVFQGGLVLDGRYRLDRPLAEGGMGSVWVGHQIALQREVAVKLLRVGTGALRERLRREALALAAVHHPSVVQVFDYGETEGGSPYLVMELVRGEPLGQRVLRLGPIEAPAAVQIALPLLEGLAVAHRAGIVHRDIKPENVVLSAGPAGVLPKLLDFGIARVAQGDEARLTADGGLIGTPAYMAPEQVRGLDVDARVDVWGIAVMLYEVLAGKPPFGIEDVVAVIRRVLDEPPPFPREARGLDGRLWSILMAAMRKNPDERIPTALAFRDSLVAWLEAKGFSASAPPAIPMPVSAPPLSPSAGMVSTQAAPAPPSPAREAVSTPPRGMGRDRVDAMADTEPNALSADPESFEALIRAKFGHS
jgi:eukaryotic-like serine/threonine-protein kinase